jgi:hypothetical protein
MEKVYADYPEYVKIRTGCKVAWITYKDIEAAEEAAKAAEYNAYIQSRQGYDFGYMMPGHITKKEDGTYEVCIP